MKTGSLAVGFTNLLPQCLHWRRGSASQPGPEMFANVPVAKRYSSRGFGPIATNFSFPSNYRNNSFPCLRNCTTPTYAITTPHNWLP